jgi:hypothetical protein
MPANRTAGAISINRDVQPLAAAAPTPTAPAGSASWGPGESQLRLSKIPVATLIPAAACFIVLPEDPEDGDEYEVLDTDGTSSPVAPVIVLPNPNGTVTTVGGLPGFAMTSAFGGLKMVYDAPAKNWVVTLTGEGLTIALQNNAGTGGTPVSPANFAGGAAINLCAFLVKVTGGFGLFRLQFALQATAAAADAALILAVQIVPNVTALTGGNTVGGVGAPTFHNETGTGAGQPVVVTGDAPVTKFTYKRQIVAGQLVDTHAFTIDLVLPVPTNPLALGTGVVVTIADTAQVISAMELETNLQAAA